MGFILIALGVVAWTIRQFGADDIKKRYGDRLLVAGIVLLMIGVGIISMGSECGTSWGTHSSESDC